MRYQQLTSHERYIVSALRKQGLSTPQIAEHLGRHRSTIYREIKRNGRFSGDNQYRPKEAHARAVRRRSVSGRNCRYQDKHFATIRKYLRRQWSPEQISGYLRVKGIFQISHETIYLFVWKDKANGGSLWMHLRQSQKRRRKRYRAYDSRGRLADKRHISERPGSVESRKYQGHWEIDTVMDNGSTDCVVTLLERKTGFVQIGKLSDRTTLSLNRKTISLINRNPYLYRTITADNGTEFHQYKIIEERWPVKFYFATPHHSWERGANENVNGLIRQYLPKGASMKDLTQQQCNAIADKLNSRPRKRFNYKTPGELYNG